MSRQMQLPKVVRYLEEHGHRDVRVGPVEAHAAGRAHDGPDGAQRGEHGHAAHHRRQRDGHGRADHVVEETPDSFPDEQVEVKLENGKGAGNCEETNSGNK